MIRSDGVMAFRGVMVIHPKNMESFSLRGEWVFRPETGCWYGCGRSFCEEICEIAEDEEE